MKYVIIELWGDSLLPILNSDGYFLEFDSRKVALEVGARMCASEFRVLEVERFIREEEHI